MTPGSSYILLELPKCLDKKPLRTDHKQMETSFHTTPANAEMSEVQMTNVEGSFTVNAEVTKVNKHNSISLPKIC